MRADPARLQPRLKCRLRSCTAPSTRLLRVLRCSRNRRQVDPSLPLQRLLQLWPPLQSTLPAQTRPLRPGQPCQSMPPHQQRRKCQAPSQLHWQATTHPHLPLETLPRSRPRRRTTPARSSASQSRLPTSETPVGPITTSPTTFRRGNIVVPKSSWAQSGVPALTCGVQVQW